VRLALSNKSVTASRKGVVPFSVGPVNEDATGTLKLVAARTAIEASKNVRLASEDVTLAEGDITTVRAKLSRVARRALRREKELHARIVLMLRDSAGNATTKRLSTTVKLAA
jgi:hypothetical protein